MNKVPKLRRSSAASKQRETVPPLFWHEMHDILSNVERRGRGQSTDPELAMKRLSALPLEVRAGPDDLTLLALARGHASTGYDAAHLALAMNRTMPIAILDKRLAAAARREGAPILGPLAP